MISLDHARALRDCGVLWQPVPGDRFVIDTTSLTGQVFWISDLTVEVHSFNEQSVLGFNGTTEWALDSVGLDQALWLPREDQLRTLLGDRFESLTRASSGQWRLRARTIDGELIDITDTDVEDAYARAILAL